MTTRHTGLSVAAATPIHLRRLLAVLGVMLTLALAAVPSAGQDGDPSPGLAHTVNINADDAATLAAVLNGVGLSRAEDIVRYREEFGPFTTVEQLSEVKGIGEATLDKNRARITLD